MALRIEIYSDVICPWCYLGKKRLEKALRLIPPEEKVEIEYRPYELNPSTPIEGVDRREYLIAKYGAAIKTADERLAELGTAEGINYQFEKARRIPNTFNAHRLIWLACREGKGGEMTEALFAAYFTEGKDLSRTAVLAGVASSIGLDLNQTEKFLLGNEGSAEVRDMETTAYDLGIPGVPFFIFYGTSTATQGKPVGFSGAQEVSTFLKVIERTLV